MLLACMMLPAWPVLAWIFGRLDNQMFRQLVAHLLLARTCAAPLEKWLIGRLAARLDTVAC